MTKRKKGEQKLSLRNNQMGTEDTRPDADLYYSYEGCEYDRPTGKFQALLCTHAGVVKLVGSTEIMRIRLSYSVTHADRTPTTKREEWLLHEDTLLDMADHKLGAAAKNRQTMHGGATAAMAMVQLAKGASTGTVLDTRALLKRVGAKQNTPATFK